MARDTLGEFEQQVLLAVLRLGGEAYSVPIVLELEDRTRREVAPAAVFVVLQRMERKGLLTSRLDDRRKLETGRTRRYFKLTPEALQRLRDARQTFLRLWDGLDPGWEEL